MLRIHFIKEFLVQGLYGTLAMLYLDPKSLTETQALMTVPHWDGKGESGVKWKESHSV